MLLYEEYQPLKISAGWKVERNLFFNVDPSEHTMSYFVRDLLFLSNNQRNQYIELEWLPEDDPNGEYGINVYHLVERYCEYSNQVKLITKDQPHLTFKSKKRVEIVAKLEELMFFLEDFKDPTVFKSPGIIDEKLDALRIELAQGYTNTIAKKIYESNNHTLQRFLIDTEEVSKDVLLTLQENGADKKIKNIAKAKLTNKKYR